MEANRFTKEAITPWGMQTIGIFIGVLYGWTVDSKIWPSLLGIVALGYLPDRTVFQCNFFIFSYVRFA